VKSTDHTTAVEERAREIARARAEIDKALAEFDEATAARDGADAAYATARKRWPTRHAPKQKGRPPIWQGALGMLLVHNVTELRRENPRRTIAQAIRLAIKTPALQPLRRYNVRTLQKRYIEAVRYVAFINNLAATAKQKGALLLACATAQRRVDKARDRLVAALGRFDRLTGQRNPWVGLL
jgi:hypothetical protein